MRGKEREGGREGWKRRGKKEREGGREEFRRRGMEEEGDEREEEGCGRREVEEERGVIDGRGEE